MQSKRASSRSAKGHIQKEKEKINNGFYHSLSIPFLIAAMLIEFSGESIADTISQWALIFLLLGLFISNGLGNLFDGNDSTIGPGNLDTATPSQVGMFCFAVLGVLYALTLRFFEGTIFSQRISRWRAVAPFLFFFNALWWGIFQNAAGVAYFFWLISTALPCVDIIKLQMTSRRSNT